MLALMMAGILAAAPAGPGAAAPPPSSAFAPVEIRTTRLADGIYQFTVTSDGYVEQLNSVAIVNADDVLVFDTTTRPSTARTILAAIRRITPKPVRFVVNSHWHPDHWSGNEVFAAAFPGLEIIATEQERDYMLNMAAMWARILPNAVEAQAKAVADQNASGMAAPGLPLTPEKKALDELDLQRSRDMTAEQLKLKRVFPTLTYNDQLTLHHGGRELRFISVTGDAAGTTVLYLPKEKILITGDAVTAPYLYFTPPLSDHARSLRMLSRFEADIIVPGHGPAFRDKSYMNLEADLLEDVVRQVTAALRSGSVTIDDVQRAVNLDSYVARFANGDPYVAAALPAQFRAMVRRAYIESRDGKEIR